MDREVDQKAEAVQRHAHRVDQKRHVVVDHLDDRVGRLPAVLLDLRIVRPDLGLARPGAAARSGDARAPRRTGPRGRDRSGPPAARPGSSGARSPRRGAARSSSSLSCRRVDHPLEQVRLLVLKPGRHGSLPSAIGSVYHRWRRPCSAASRGRRGAARIRALRPYLGVGYEWAKGSGGGPGPLPCALRRALRLTFARNPGRSPIGEAVAAGGRRRRRAAQRDSKKGGGPSSMPAARLPIGDASARCRARHVPSHGHVPRPSRARHPAARHRVTRLDRGRARVICCAKLLQQASLRTMNQPQAAAPLLRVEGLTKRFGPVVALDDVSFEVACRARWWACSATTAPASRP